VFFSFLERKCVVRGRSEYLIPGDNENCLTKGGLVSV
jgi:hypothetical protein